MHLGCIQHQPISKIEQLKIKQIEITIFREVAELCQGHDEIRARHHKGELGITTDRDS